MLKHVVAVLVFISILLLIRLPFWAEEKADEEEFKAVCVGEKLVQGGRRSVTVVPTPGVLATLTVPPNRCVTWL